MRGAFFAALYIVLLGSALVAPGRHVDVDDYPLEVGRRWTYRSLGAVLVVRRVTGVREVAGCRTYDMEYQLPVLGRHVVPMRRTREGVVTVREGREHLLLRFPMRVGDRWRIDLPGEREIADCEVMGEEEVNYLGRRGTATRLSVTRVTRSTGRRVVDYEWYAPGVGLVRMDVTYGLRATFVLERFE